MIRDVGRRGGPATSDSIRTFMSTSQTFRVTAFFVEVRCPMFFGGGRLGALVRADRADCLFRSRTVPSSRLCRVAAGVRLAEL